MSEEKIRGFFDGDNSERLMNVAKDFAHQQGRKFDTSFELVEFYVDSMQKNSRSQ